MKGHTITGIFPAIVLEDGKAVSLQATLYVHEPSESDAISEFKNQLFVQADNGGPPLNPKTAIAYIIKEGDHT